MSVIETLLVFVAIPIGIIALVFAMVYGRSMVRQPNRYRPGKSWDYPPAWYVPHPDAVTNAVDPSQEKAQTTAVGGASGEW
ncbi:aa3-type cytochrome oxidase subunit CtaJ [Jatrophihabitans fulvus]